MGLGSRGRVKSGLGVRAWGPYLPEKKEGFRLIIP